jgi:hypothetical protein
MKGEYTTTKGYTMAKGIKGISNGKAAVAV